MKVLSLFDGISCAREALEKAGIEVDLYFASEIDEHAIKISQKNHSDHIPLGDVTKVTKEMIEGYSVFCDTDLLIGGSPCQDLSIAKKGREGLKGSRSSLFYEYVRILNEVKPKWFILENVASMSQQDKDIISKELGIEPVMINAALVSAQNRKRLFWVGEYDPLKRKNYKQVHISQPDDRSIFLKDILLDGSTEDMKSLCITATYAKKTGKDYLKKGIGQMIRIGDIGSNAQAHRVYSPDGKSVALSALGGGQGAKTGLYLVQKPRGKNKGGIHIEKSPTLTSSSFEHNNHIVQPVALRNRGEGKKPEYNGTGKANAMTSVQTDSMVDIGSCIRKLHPIECERLQGLPDNYTEGISNTQRYKCLGNAFNVDVIAHILSFLKDSFIKNDEEKFI